MQPREVVEQTVITCTKKFGWWIQQYGRLAADRYTHGHKHTTKHMIPSRLMAGRHTSRHTIRTKENNKEGKLYDFHYSVFLRSNPPFSWPDAKSFLWNYLLKCFSLNLAWMLWRISISPFLSTFICALYKGSFIVHLLEGNWRGKRLK